jgi:hypothetical protein
MVDILFHEKELYGNQLRTNMARDTSVLGGSAIRGCARRLFRKFRLRDRSSICYFRSSEILHIPNESPTKADMSMVEASRARVQQQTAMQTLL